MPPLASNFMLFLLSARASRIWAGVMLSRRIASMPSTSTKARTCSRLSASTSIRMFGRSCRSRRIRSAKPESSPSAARWLSFTITMSYKPNRWLAPPPATTAAFSNARSPGVVLRVSNILVEGFPTASTNWRVSVAMPQRRCKKLSATRSALRIERARPRTSIIMSPAAILSPSWQASWMPNEASTCRKACAAASVPATTAFSRATMRPVACSVSGTKKSVVTSPSAISSSRAAAIGSQRFGFMSAGKCAQ